jgi:hypothetical protein
MHWKSAPIAMVASVAFGLAGCGIGQVITAPVRYVFHSPEPTPTPSSDVAHPGRPLPAPTPAPRVASHQTTKLSSSTTAKPTGAKTSPSAATAAQFPVAKPVPGKPGLVFNPFKSNGGYIDVSGYAPGSKVKDPETQKIFVVP